MSHAIGVDFTNLEDAKKNTADAKEAPVGNEAHASLGSTPSHYTDGKEQASTKFTKDKVGWDLAGG